MPALKKTPDERDDLKYRALIYGQMKALGITTRALAGYLDLDEDTLRYKLKDTNKLWLSESRVIDRVLKISTVRAV